jgi:hypothetical protein
MKKQLLTLGMIAALSGVAFADAGAGSPAAGKTKNAMCQGCHGQPGWRTAFPEVYTVPKLGGQNPNYIVAALKEYKSGERAHSTMQAIAAGLTEQDMADLAAFYAEKK